MDGGEAGAAALAEGFVAAEEAGADLVEGGVVAVVRAGVGGGGPGSRLGVAGGVGAGGAGVEGVEGGFFGCGSGVGGAVAERWGGAGGVAGCGRVWRRGGRGRHEALGFFGLGEGVAVGCCFGVGDGDGVGGHVAAAEGGATAAGGVDGDSAEGEDEGAHEFGSAGGADCLVCPVGLKHHLNMCTPGIRLYSSAYLMSDLDL